MNTPLVIPASAWQQYGIVCLFVVFCLYLLWMVFKYVFNHFRNITSSMDMIIDKFLTASELRDEKFIEAIQRSDNDASLRSDISVAAMGVVATKLDSLNTSFLVHDTRMEQALADMRTAISKRKNGDIDKEKPA